MMTIQEIRQKLYSKEILSESDLLSLRGGDGEEDKRKELLELAARALTLLRTYVKIP